MRQILDRAYIDRAPNYIIQIGDEKWQVLRKHLSYFPVMGEFDTLTDAHRWCDTHPSVSDAKDAAKRLNAFNRIRRPLDPNFHERARVILEQASNRIKGAIKADETARSAVNKYISDQISASKRNYDAERNERGDLPC